MASTLNKILSTISGGAIAVAGAIWVAKPPAELPQMPGAQIVIQADARSVPAHAEVYQRDSVTWDTVQVAAYIQREQVRTAPDSAYRPGDVFRKVVYRNDSIVFESRIAIEEETYPAGGVLRVHDYTQWVISQGE